MLRIMSSVLFLISMATPIWAQGTTSSGLFGSRTVGGSSISPGSRNAFGSGSGSSFGATGMGVGQQSNTGQITGAERFVRGNRTAGQFVGTDTADTSFVGALSSGTTGGFSSGLSGLGGRGGMGGGSGAEALEAWAAWAEAPLWAALAATREWVRTAAT